MAIQREDEAAEGFLLPMQVPRRKRIKGQKVTANDLHGPSERRMGRKVDFTAICCQNSRATGAIGRMGHANSVSGRRGPEWESSRPKSGTGLGKRALFCQTVVALVGAGKRPREAARWCRNVRGNGGRRELVLSASRVNWCVGRSAPDRQAPRTVRLSSRHPPGVPRAEVSPRATY